MKKKVIIIGGAGFIGKNLSRYLSNQNIKVKIIDKYIENISVDPNFYQNMKIGQVDVNETSKIIDHLEDYENIIWLVHNSVPSNSMLDISNDLINNIIPLINFLNRIKDNPNIEKFIFLSSGGTVYGNQIIEKPIKETDEINPVSNYGLTKNIAEKYIKLLLQSSNISSFILRPSNVYGTDQNLNKPQGIIGHAFKAALNNHQLFLYNNGKIIRDFIHVNDLSDAILKCIINITPKSSFFTYNIGSGEAMSMNNVIELINKITNKKILTINKPKRSFDCNYNVLDCSKLKNEYNWKPKIIFKDGLISVYDWIKNIE